MASRIGALRRKIVLGQYELTGHAKGEMEQDDLTIGDVRQAVLTGRIIATQRDRAHRKWLVAGRSLEDQPVRVVCRLTSSGKLRILTVFAL